MGGEIAGDRKHERKREGERGGEKEKEREIASIVYTGSVNIRNREKSEKTSRACKLTVRLRAARRQNSLPLKRKNFPF